MSLPRIEFALRINLFCLREIRARQLAWFTGSVALQGFVHLMATSLRLKTTKKTV